MQNFLYRSIMMQTGGNLAMEHQWCPSVMIRAHFYTCLLHWFIFLDVFSFSETCFHPTWWLQLSAQWVAFFPRTHTRTLASTLAHTLCPELIFVDHFLHVNSSFISNWESHKMEWPFLSLLNKYLPSSLTTKQPCSYHRKLIPFLGAWQPGLVHWVVPHGQLLNSEHTLLKGRSWGSG